MSVHRLPAEIIQTVVSYVDGKRAPYTVVCRSWQAAFERQIYSTLDVVSAKRKDNKGNEIGLAIDLFQKLTSGTPYRVARRAMIRK